MGSEILRTRILVIKLGAFGDFIQTLGIMRAIRQTHKEAHITLMTTKPFEQLARSTDYFDDIWVTTRPGLFQLGTWFKMRNTFRQSQYSRVYDLQNNKRTARYRKFFNAEWQSTAWITHHKGNDIGYYDGLRQTRRPFDSLARLVMAASIRQPTIDDLSWIKPQNDLSLKQPYFLIVPGASAHMKMKIYPAQQYGFICAQLTERGIHSYIIGGPSEENIAKEIRSVSPDTISLCGKTEFVDLPHLARNAMGAIGNDTGPLHMIGPTGCPTLALFSNHSDPKRFAPLGPNVHYLQSNNIADINITDILALIDNKILSHQHN
jgi:ADP-heptose:LPS heptosyltransferase